MEPIVLLETSRVRLIEYLRYRDWTVSTNYSRHPLNSTGLPVVLANKIQGHFQVFKCVLGIFQGYSSIFQGYFPNKKNFTGIYKEVN